MVYNPISVAATPGIGSLQIRRSPNAGNRDRWLSTIGMSIVIQETVWSRLLLVDFTHLTLMLALAMHAAVDSISSPIP